MIVRELGDFTADAVLTENIERNLQELSSCVDWRNSYLNTHLLLYALLTYLQCIEHDAVETLRSLIIQPAPVSDPNFRKLAITTFELFVDRALGQSSS